MSQPKTIHEAIREVYFWQYSRSDCFNQLLLDLFQKADRENREILSKGFPMLYQAWEMWNNSEKHGDELFMDMGLPLRHRNCGC